MTTMTLLGEHPNLANDERASLDAFLATGEVLDHSHDGVCKFVEKSLQRGSHDSRSAAVELYYAVRDGIFYEIFDTELGDHLSASTVVQERRGFCLHKAVLYAAACRAAGIPSRILAAPVRNHVSSAAIGKLVGGDVFLHWYDEIMLDGEWLKVAPIFNRLTCRLHGIQPLEFDGRHAAIEQPYVGKSRMVYLADAICFTNPSRADLISLVASYHPRMVNEFGRVPAEKAIGLVSMRRPQTVQ